MPLIDFSKISLKNTPPKVTALTIPAKGRKIDFNAIKGPVVAAPVVRPVRQDTVGTGVSTSTWQKTLSKPTPSTTSRLTGKTVEQRTLEGKQMTAAFAGKSLFDGFKEGVDSYNNATAKGFMGGAAPAEGGITGNRWVDFTASLTTMGAVIQTGIQVVGGIVSAINFTRAMNSKWNWPTVEGGVASNNIAVRVAQANPNMDKGTASSIASLVARTGGNQAQLSALASNTSALSRSLNQMSLAARNPSAALNVIPSALRTITQTGIFQSIPMPAGLVHSTAPAIPMGRGTLPAVTSALITKQPWEMTKVEFAKAYPMKKSPYSNKGFRNELITDKAYSNPTGGLISARKEVIQKALSEGKPVPSSVLADYPDLKATAPAPQIAVATEPYVSRDKFQVEHPLLEVAQPAVPGVKTTKSMDTIMAEEEAAGRKLETAPRAVDKTIPAIDVKRANLVDVTAKVDLKSVQVKFPSADKVVLDTKRRTVMFMHGTTPLEAVGVEKPQLNEWYGIDGAKLLGEATQPAPVVAQIAPALSKMETPIVQKPTIPTFQNQNGSPATPTIPEELQPLVAEAKKYGSVAQFVGAIEHAKYLTTPGLMVGQKNLPVGGELIDTVLDQKGGAWYRVKTMGGTVAVIPVEQAKVITGWRGDLVDFYDTFVGKPASVSPSLSTTPQRGTATTISNQKTGISTSPPISLQGEAKTGAGGVIPAVAGKKVAFKASNGSELVGSIISIPELSDFTIAAVREEGGGWHAHELTSGYSLMVDSMGIVKTRKALGELIVGQLNKVKKYGESSPADALLRMVSPTKIVNPEYSRPTEISPPAPMTSTSAPAAAPSLGNAAPAHGLIDYSKIELNGTTSVTSPTVLKSVSNTGKRSRVETEGFDNYIQNTAGTKDTPLSFVEKFKEKRDGYIRAIVNEYDWFFKSPLGGEWMTIAVAADDVLKEEYIKPFSINDAGGRVYAEGEFAPAILARYLKASDVVKERYLQKNGVDLVDAKGKKIPNPNYGKPAFGIFLQHLQRAGISTEPTVGLSPEKEALKQTHIFDARMSLANFQKNDPQLFQAYMAQAQEIGDANARLLPEFYKGIISPETYANGKANPHYYVSLSAGKTDIFDRSGVAPLEHARGLTNLDEVVPPLEGLIAVYVDAIRARGINMAKMATVAWNKNSEVATTDLSDSIVHLWDDGVDRAYEVHDKDAGESIRNLTRSKWVVPSELKQALMAPTTLLRLFATGVNIAFGVFNPVRDIIQSAGLVPFTPKGLVKGTVQAFKSPGLSRWSEDYRDPTRPTGTKVAEAVKKIVEIASYPSEVGETSSRKVIQYSIEGRGGTYLDQFYGYHAGTGFFALHGTIFNDFISGLVPFTRATIAIMRSAYRNAFYGLPIGDKGGTFSGKQGAEKILGKNFLATIIFTVLSIMGIKAAGKEKEYKLLRNRASFFYIPQPSNNWVKLPVPIGSAPIKAIVESLFGYESDPMGVAGQTLNVIPGLEAFMLPPALTLFLQYKFNLNFFTGSPINTGADTPAANPLEAAIMKAGYTEEEAALALRAFFADIPSQVQYVFEMVTQGSSTQASPLTKRFIVKDPTTSSNAAVDDFYALVDAAKLSKNPALESFVNARANAVGDLLHNAKLYPENAKTYIVGATDFIIATFALIAENPSVYGIKKFGPHSWRPSGNYEELAP